jgi:hypothetical protein
MSKAMEKTGELVNTTLASFRNIRAGSHAREI